MKIKELFARLKKSKQWKETFKEEKRIFFCAAFVILNFKQNIFEYSLDFRNDKDLLTFKFPKEENQDLIVVKDKLLENPKPLDEIKETLLSQIKIDIEDLKEIVEKNLLENKVGKNLDEIIAVLQYYEGNFVWNLTCICEGFTIVSIHLDPLSKKIVKFEKRNLMDFVNIKKVYKK